MAVRSFDPTKTRNRAALKEFAGLERGFLKGQRLHVSEEDAQVVRRLSGRSYLLDDAELCAFVSDDDGGHPVARCVAIINRRWQRSRRDPGVIDDARNVGFIGYFGAKPDKLPEAQEMLAAAETWLRSEDRELSRAGDRVNRVIAPCNGNVLLGTGLLTDDFAESPIFPMPWSPRYYIRYLQRSGYMPRYPIWFFKVDFSSPEYQDFKKRAVDYKPVVREVNKDEWDDEVELLRELHNEGFRGEWELQDFTGDEFKEFYAPFKDMLPEQFVLFVSADRDSDPVGFAFGYPDWTPQARALHGRTPTEDFGTGPDDFARAMVIGGAMRRSVRGAYVGAKLAYAFFTRMEEYGLPGAWYGYVNHANAASRGLAELAGGKGRILYHCFDKTIIPPGEWP